MQYVWAQREAPQGGMVSVWVPTVLRCLDGGTGVLAFNGYIDDAAVVGGMKPLTTIECPVILKGLRGYDQVLKKVTHAIIAEEPSFLLGGVRFTNPGNPGIHYKKEVMTERGHPAHVWERKSVRLDFLKNQVRSVFWGYGDADTLAAEKQPVTRHPKWTVQSAGILQSLQFEAAHKELLTRVVKDKTTPLYGGSLRVL